MANNKNVNDIEKYAKQRGMTVVEPRKGGKHMKIYDGARLISACSMTPSDGRSLKNVIAQIDRAVRMRNEAQEDNRPAASPARGPARQRHGARRR